MLTMAYCVNCGHDAGESKFCPECGTRLVEPVPSSEAEQVQAVNIDDTKGMFGVDLSKCLAQ